MFISGSPLTFLTVDEYLYNQAWTSHINLNPPVTTRVKIRQNVGILAKVYRVHLKVEHCQTSRVVSTFTGQNGELTVFDW